MNFVNIKLEVAFFLWERRVFLWVQHLCVCHQIKLIKPSQEGTWFNFMDYSTPKSLKKYIHRKVEHYCSHMFLTPSACLHCCVLFAEKLHKNWDIFILCFEQLDLLEQIKKIFMMSNSSSSMHRYFWVELLKNATKAFVPQPRFLKSEQWEFSFQTYLNEIFFASWNCYDKALTESGMRIQILMPEFVEKAWVTSKKQHFLSPLKLLTKKSFIITLFFFNPELFYIAIVNRKNCVWRESIISGSEWN